MSQAVEKYGTQIISELLDKILIDGKVTNQEFRAWLIKHKVIQKSTRIVEAYMQRDEQVYYDGSYHWDNPRFRGWVVYAYNGRGKVIFRTSISIDELPHIMEEIRVARCEEGRTDS